MNSKIAKTFENCRRKKRAALITYTVAGDNTKKNSLNILNSSLIAMLSLWNMKSSTKPTR